MEFLSKEEQKKQLLILGETHGIVANLIVIDWLVQNWGASVILFELEEKWTHHLQKISSPSGLRKFIRAVDEERWITEGGLIGREHIPFLRLWNTQNVTLRGVKIEHKDWNKAEKLTVENVARILHSQQNKKIIFVTGNFHARKSKFDFVINNKIYTAIPMGMLLKKYSISMCIKYEEGRFRNFGIRKIHGEHTSHISTKNGPIIKKSRSKYYDYNVLTGHAYPIAELD